MIDDLKNGTCNREMNRRMAKMMKVKIPEFDGKIPWSKYLRQFGAAIVLNEWNEKEKATMPVFPLVERL